MKHRYLSTRTITIILLCCCGAFILIPVMMQSNGEAPPVTGIEVLEDPAGSYTFEQVRKGSVPAQFARLPDGTSSLGITRSAFWLRFRAPAAGGEMSAGSRVLELKNPNYDKIDLYLPVSRESGGSPDYQPHSAGLQRPEAASFKPANTWVFTLPDRFAAGEYMYLRLESGTSLRIPIAVQSQDEFMRQALSDGLAYGFFYGILTAMILYNMFLYLSLRDKAYLYYVLYMTFMLIAQFRLNGHMPMLIDLPFRVYTAMLWILLSLMVVFAFGFARYFMNTATYMPVFDKVLTGSAVVALIPGIMGIAEMNSLASLLIHLMGFWGPSAIIVLAIMRWRQGFLAARYFLLAWSALAVGTFFYVSAAHSLATISFSWRYLALGTAAEAILLSFALADRINSWREEKELLRESVRHYHNLSIVDGLTGLYNRRYLMERLRQEIEGARWKKGPLAVMMVDIDDYKRYNDSYGHPEGDKVLVRLAEVMVAHLRTRDTACRYGGEEFVVILPGLEGDNAVKVAERIRKSFADEAFLADGKETGAVTVSIGVTLLRDRDTADNLIKRVDDALYRAKNQGKNRVLFV